MSNVAVVTVWILIAVVFSAHPSTTVVHDFNSKQSCERALAALEEKWVGTDGICIPQERDE